MRILNCQKGYTMIETIGVIAIIGVVGSSAVAFLNKAFLRYKITRLSQQVVEIQKSIDKRFAAKKTYEGLNIKLLAKEGLLPNDMIYKNNVLYHKFKGTVTLTLGTNSENYTITFNNVPSNACTELVEQNWGLDQRVILDEMRIEQNQKQTKIDNKTTNRTVNKVADQGTKLLKWNCPSPRNANCYTMPLSASAASTVCSGKNKNISWTFY